MGGPVGRRPPFTEKRPLGHLDEDAFCGLGRVVAWCPRNVGSLPAQASDTVRIVAIRVHFRGGSSRGHAFHIANNQGNYIPHKLLQNPLKNGI